MTPEPPPDELRFDAYGASVPPPYHSSTFSTLDADGTGTARTERSYGKGETTEMPLALAPEALAALWTDLRALGLFTTAWAPNPAKRTVGGGTWRLTATHRGESTTVPPNVADDQAEARRAIGDRVREALRAARL